MKSILELKFKRLSKKELNPLIGGYFVEAVTNSHGRITKSAGNFDADNKNSDSDTSSFVQSFPIAKPYQFE